MLNADQVIDRLLQCAAGQIVACNIVAGVENRLIDRRWVSEVLALMGALGDLDGYAEPMQFVRALDDLKTRTYRPDVSLPTEQLDIRMHGAAEPTPFEVEVSCVLPAWVLGKVMSSEDKRRLAREGLSMPTSPTDFLADSTIGEWRNRPRSTRTARLDPASSLGRQHSVVWFTRRDALEEALAAEDAFNLAQRTRDLLGLVHHQQGAMLSVLHFPPRTMSACLSCRPTFADASSHARFKTWPDGDAARTLLDWGNTVDLRALDAAATSVDGCPERVTKTFEGRSLSNAGTFEFDLLGAVQTPLGRNDAADTTFANRLMNGLTASDIGAKLKAMNTRLEGFQQDAHVH